MSNEARTNRFDSHTVSNQAPPFADLKLFANDPVGPILERTRQKGYGQTSGMDAAPLGTAASPDISSTKPGQTGARLG